MLMMTFLDAFHLILRLTNQIEISQSWQIVHLVNLWWKGLPSGYHIHFWTTISFPKFWLNQWYLILMWFEVGVTLGHVSTILAPLLSSYTVHLDTISRFSLFFPKLSPTSLIRIFKGNKSLTKFYNTTYSECRV